MKQQDQQAVDRRAAADEIIVAALASGRSHQEAGDLAGVSTKTVQRRMAEQGFADQVRQARRNMVGRTTGMLTNLEADAVGALRDVLSDGTHVERLRASQLILSIGHKRRDLEDLALRVLALEAQLEEAQRAGSGEEW